ncbi:hypothetical protein JQ617_09635 [Bradyrhizobium sp. KB893862 SZCCT0404]|uniref:hypothetical protein n=1 Tax=Bradyrhizobium sp. KB893862 SZCCT0404 TaxID=2807672 RepID=UPI001BA77A0D|nr:hypothetical protein [Bradyrhizobium sp. KB893862 SZCCT0404]MBR1174215.1 hypothetical protein [Bradyrhizobium sp. KB893862 SZCCT0404]
MTSYNQRALIWACLSALVCLFIFIFAGPQITDFWYGNADTVWHIESVSLSLYGRFHGAALVTDAYSGEFPTYYNFLSDWLINLIAYATRLPPFQAQAVIYVPLLLTLLFLGSYFSMRALDIDRCVGVFMALLVVGAGETPFVHYLYPILERFSGVSQTSGNLIPPAESMGVASSQDFGWVLFLPVLASLYCAKRGDRAIVTLFAGALLGLACLAHTLTFLQLATTVSVYVAADGIASLIRAGRIGNAIARASVIVIVLALMIVRGKMVGLSMLSFVIFWSTCFLASLVEARSVRFTAIYGASAAIVASPYALQIWQLSLQAGRFEEVDSYARVPTIEFVLFHLVYIAAALIVLLNARRLGRLDRLIWLSVMLLVSVGMGLGTFGLNSHAYRFWTNAIIPFALFAGLSVAVPSSLSRKIVVGLIVPLVLIGVIRNLWVVRYPLPQAISRTVGSVESYNGARPLPSGAAALLDQIREQTASLPPGSRLLVPPEYDYPQQAYRNGLMLAVSSVPSFVPDPRYIMWHDLYVDRVAVFCSLFPAYPQFDMHTKTRLCDKTPKQLAPGHLDLIDARAGTDVLALYRIKLLALLQGPPADTMIEQAQRLGLKLIYDRSGSMLWDTTPQSDPDRISFGAATYREPNLSIAMVAPQAGRYIVVLAGREIATTLRQLQSGNTPVELHPLGADAIAAIMDLPSGSSEMTFTLTSDRRFRSVFPTPIRLIVGVKQEAAEKVFTGPSLQQLLR